MGQGDKAHRGVWRYAHSPFQDQTNTPSKSILWLLSIGLQPDIREISLTGQEGLDSGVKWRDVEQVTERPLHRNRNLSQTIIYPNLKPCNPQTPISPYCYQTFIYYIGAKRLSELADIRDNGLVICIYIGGILYKNQKLFCQIFDVPRPNQDSYPNPHSQFSGVSKP